MVVVFLSVVVVGLKLKRNHAGNFHFRSYLDNWRSKIFYVPLLTWKSNYQCCLESQRRKMIYTCGKKDTPAIKKVLLKWCQVERGNLTWAELHNFCRYPNLAAHNFAPLWLTNAYSSFLESFITQRTLLLKVTTYQ